MSKSEIEKEVEKALKEQQRKQEWERQLNRNLQEIAKADREAQRALLGAFVAPAAIIATAVAADKRRWKQTQKAAPQKRQKSSFAATLGKAILFILIVGVVANVVEDSGESSTTESKSTTVSSVESRELSDWIGLTFREAEVISTYGVDTVIEQMDSSGKLSYEMGCPYIFLYEGDMFSENNIICGIVAYGSDVRVTNGLKIGASVEQTEKALGTTLDLQANDGCLECDIVRNGFHYLLTFSPESEILTVAGCYRA